VKQWYDKIVLGVAVVALLVALLLFLRSRGDLPSAEAPVRIADQGEPFEMAPPTPQAGIAANWSEPAARDEAGLWLYQVFTPPILYIRVDEDGNRFLDPRRPEVEQPEEEEDVIPFGVRLIAIEQELYRVQIDAVFERTPAEPRTATFIIEYLEAEPGEASTERMRVGDSSDRLGIRIDDAKVSEVRGPDGGLERIFIVTIFDLRRQRALELRDDRPRYDERPVFVISSTLDPSAQVRIREVGERFQMNDASYTVIDLDAGDESISLVKEADYLEISESETLSVDDRPLRPVERETITEDPEGIDGLEEDPSREELMQMFEF